MRCARPTRPRTTRATVRFGSSLSPPVTSLAAALLTALVAEPASRPPGKQQPCCTSKSPRLCPGTLLLRTAISQVRRACSFQRGSLVADDLLQAVAAGHHGLNSERPTDSDQGTRSSHLERSVTPHT